MRIKTLNDIYDRKNNSFDDLRFIFAAMVLYVHSFVLLYGQDVKGTDPFTIATHFQLSPGTLAVYGFFVLSGFFMIQSLEANSSLLVYAKNRILRIVPAFWLALFLSSFIVVPLIFENSPILSIQPGSALYFFYHSAIFQAMGSVWIIDGAYINNPISSINGSMWTLKYEIMLYIFLPICYIFVYKSRKLFLVITALLMALSIAYIFSDFMLFKIFNADEYSKLLLLSTYFFYGTLFYLYRDVIIVSKRFIIVFIFIFILSMFFTNFKLITLLILPYLIISMGSILKTKIFSKTGDYSYGMYIYAFPIQQTLVHFYKNSLTAETLFIFSFLLTLIFSILSWHFFEKRILRLKHKKETLHV